MGLIYDVNVSKDLFPMGLIFRIQTYLWSQSAPCGSEPKVTTQSGAQHFPRGERPSHRFRRSGA